MFWLAPRPALERPRSGSPRMFRVELLERHLSRVRPREVVAVWAPFAAWLLWRAARDPALPGGRAASLVVAGVAAWTLLEYVLHRFAFHADLGQGELGRDLHYLVHGVHHDYPHDPDRLVMPPAVAAVLAVLIGWPLHAAVGSHAFPPLFAGLVCGYLWYDLTHYWVHHGRARTALGRKLKRWHLRHHFQEPASRFGVTTPLWDHVFGTAPREAPLRAAAGRAR